MNDETTMAAMGRLMTVAQFAEAHPAFTVGGLRNLLFFRETNGLEAAVRRVGRRLLILEPAFFAWIESTNRKGPGPVLHAEPRTKATATATTKGRRTRSTAAA